MSKDYTDAPFYALGSFGYGKGFTAEEALDNYVATQQRNFRIKDLVFKTKAEFEAYLRDPANVSVWKAPEGTTGYQTGYGANYWLDAEGNKTEIQWSDEVKSEVSA